MERVWAERFQAAVHEAQKKLILLRRLSPRPGATIQRNLAELSRLRRVMKRGYGGHAIVHPCRCVEERWRNGRQSRVQQFAEIPVSMERMTFENWHPRTDLTDSQNEVLMQAFAEAQKFAMGETEYKLLLLTGPRGSGKTHLVVSIVRAMAARLELARYRFTPALVQELLAAVRDQRDDGPTVNDLIQSYREVGMLALDDLGAGREVPTPWCLEQIEAIIKERYEAGRPLVVATNLAMRDLGGRWSPRIADCLWDTHTGKVRQLMLNVPSYRTGEVW